MHQLSLAQLKTLDCGTKNAPDMPAQVSVPGAQISTLDEVFAPVYGDRSVRSPWTADLNWWKHQNPGKLTRSAGASTVSANWQVHDPAQGAVTYPDWYLRQNPAYFHGPDVRTLQTRYGLKIVPYTVNDATVMQRVIDLGVDRIITDEPELLVSVAVRNGLR
ncbi:glycerophosphodiester phosphodiesterase family protein [Micromonospora sp. LOL_024]|uniref:glycerophosphodiester phosphodiesterase family protein n=1 Tax=Micromonospora sp. LOL_024 TaxID=3345412 RepID=UPI003A88383F